MASHGQPGWWGKRRTDREAMPGRKRPYRPCPPDFREQFLRHGWAVESVFATNWRCVARWVDECGGPELLAERRAAWLKSIEVKPEQHGRHAKGWSAARIEALQRGEPVAV